MEVWLDVWMKGWVEGWIGCCNGRGGRGMDGGMGSHLDMSGRMNGWVSGHFNGETGRRYGMPFR